MSKRLPYFQFEPAEWLAGDIMFCSFAAQGLFVTLKSLYWQRDCDLDLDKAIRRFNNEELFQELIYENIIKIENGKIKINFLDQQYEEALLKSKKKSINGSLGGRPRKQSETENKPNEKLKETNVFNSVIEAESKTKLLKKDKIREYNIIENNKREEEIPLSKNSNENFSRQRLESKSWIETVSMQNKITPDEVPKWIDIFNKKLDAEMDIKISEKEYASHFSRWLPTEILKQNKNTSQTQNKGKQKFYINV